MVTISDFPLKIKNFISRDQFETIKARVQRVPIGKYSAKDDIISCSLLDSKGKTLKIIDIHKILYPGVLNSFLFYKEDMESLIDHVEKADEENDKLLDLVKKLTDKVRQLENVKT